MGANLSFLSFLSFDVERDVVHSLRIKRAVVARPGCSSLICPLLHPVSAAPHRGREEAGGVSGSAPPMSLLSCQLLMTTFHRFTFFFCFLCSLVRLMSPWPVIGPQIQSLISVSPQCGRKTVIWYPEMRSGLVGISRSVWKQWSVKVWGDKWSDVVRARWSQRLEQRP